MPNGNSIWPHTGFPIFICVYDGDPQECHLCGGWVHAGDPPEVPVGEQPIGGRYCSTECYDEAVSMGWA